ncbi:hypothetical protein [Streptomyces sp. SID161]|uniref:hypothetical protein n=1 Tax=Streptomyces sp. SID161 TaxID=2690251 RepID=UPI001F3A1041|nr:hypothetical protein [Streptomyces sp. SID161]
MGEVKDVRRPAREVGRRVGRRPKVLVVGASLFAYDGRTVPKESSKPAAGNAADAIDA